MLLNISPVNNFISVNHTNYKRAGKCSFGANPIAVAADSFEKSFSCVKTISPVKKAVQYIDKLTGKISEAVVTFTRKGSNSEIVSAQVGNEVIGGAHISPDALAQYIPPFNYGTPQMIEQLGNCVYVNMMRSFKRGGGTVLHKAIAQKSIDMGYKGRVFLDAAWSSQPFHYSCGYREFAIDSIKTEPSPWIEKIIEDYKKTKVRIKKDYGAYNMFLSENNARELLSKLENYNFTTDIL